MATIPGNQWLNVHGFSATDKRVCYLKDDNNGGVAKSHHVL
jgi:hypothetical protein